MPDRAITVSLLWNSDTVSCGHQVFISIAHISRIALCQHVCFCGLLLHGSSKNLSSAPQGDIHEEAPTKLEPITQNGHEGDLGISQSTHPNIHMCINKWKKQTQWSPWIPTINSIVGILKELLSFISSRSLRGLDGASVPKVKRQRAARNPNGPVQTPGPRFTPYPTPRAGGPQEPEAAAPPEPLHTSVTQLNVPEAVQPFCLWPCLYCS